MGLLEKVRFEVPLTDGQWKPAEGFTTATPGLVVQRRLPEDVGPAWHVVHVRSGSIVASGDEPETMMHLADKFGALIDWTLSGAEIRSNIDKGALYEMRTPAGTPTGPKCPPSAMTR